jgi:hypothetical protein
MKLLIKKKNYKTNIHTHNPNKLEVC